MFEGGGGVSSERFWLSQCLEWLGKVVQQNVRTCICTNQSGHADALTLSTVHVVTMPLLNIQQAPYTLGGPAASTNSDMSCCNPAASEACLYVPNHTWLLLHIVCRYLRATDPFSLPDLRDMALCLAEQRPEEALPLLREYLAVAPGAADHDMVCEVLAQVQLRVQLGRAKGW